MKPNDGAALDAAMALLLGSERHWQRASERGAWPHHTQANDFFHRPGA
jgi:hypothetical protein